MNTDLPRPNQGARRACLNSPIRWLFCALVMLPGGCGTDQSAESHGIAPAVDAIPAFVDVTDVSDLGSFSHTTGAEGNLWFPEINGSGVAIIDYDGDGWPDILLAGGGTWSRSDAPTLALYRNERDGTFGDRTSEAGLDGIRDYTYGFAVGDYDNDGDQDFYVTSVGRNRMMQNDGGSFTDVTAAAGLSAPDEWSSSAAFLDVDQDGTLDLFVANYVQWSPETDVECTFGPQRLKDYCTPDAYSGLAPRFYRNVGEGMFVEATVEAGFDRSDGKSLGVAVLDYNRDGWLDVAVSNDTRPDHLFENLGDGTFREIGMISGMAVNSRGQPQAGMGIDVGVIDGTGFESIVIGNFSNETMGLYRYAGDGFFVDRVRDAQLAIPSQRTLTFGLVFLDANLDGHLDLFAANGHVSLHVESMQEGTFFEQAPHLFLNDGEGRFADVAPEIEALTERGLGRGVAVADFDLDGDLDVIMTQNGARARLLRNETRGSAETTLPAYVRVSVEGNRNNRSGIGTEVVVYSEGNRQHRRVRSGSSYLSQSELPVSFGLGSAARIDSIVVAWPGGQKDVHRDLDVNRAYHFVE